MISKILFHLYAVYFLVVVTLLGLNTIAYYQASFNVARAQALAIITLVQKIAGA